MNALSSRSPLAWMALVAWTMVSTTPVLADGKPAPLVIGDTFTLASKILGETRRINVYRPPGYEAESDRRYPVLYMPDGGMHEDFLHIAGLVQISTINGTMRPFLLVGIENTERRRDLTGPTKNERDKTIAPRVGGAKAFRAFLRDELMPHIRSTYRTTDETALVGESLAGLFTVETFLREPTMFDTYIAVEPSLWWNDQALIHQANKLLAKHGPQPRTLYLAAGGPSEITELTARFAAALEANAKPSLTWHHRAMPDETHATIYHPAALAAFRTLFAPPPAEAGE